MADFSTTYMGLKLSNPIVVSSCSLTGKIETIKRCANAEAGAIVIRSLFEEQIRSRTDDLEGSSWIYEHPEAMDYIENMSMLLGPRKYIELIKKAKSGISIPVIASLNCMSHEWWMGYATQIEEAGADALELNISLMPTDIDGRSDVIENTYFEILNEVKSHVNIPIVVKIDPHFTCIARMANELCRRGADALVLFNRYYRPDIDIGNLEVISGSQFSSPNEMNLSLRWVALLYGRIDCDLSASTGIHDGAAVIKQLLAGATVAQISSTLYLNGLGQIKKILEYVENWMNEKGFESIDEIRGMMSQEKVQRPELYERLQYIKVLSGTPVR